ncbi:MAG TPA: fibronectin type III domain-containing protein [Gaiellaceae bacterium]|nr:fibronectin type III domain-containing protein [Gaiellaceae bacterium]
MGVARYFVFRDGRHVASVTATAARLTGLSCGHSYTIGVSAYDAAGNHSTTRSISGSTSRCPDTRAPTAPSNPHVTAHTTTTLTLAWTASTDNVAVVGYAVSLNNSHPMTVTGTSATLGGLSCGQSYTIGVSAFDAAGNRSTTTSTSASTTACSTLSAGQSLHPGQSLLSPGGAYRLVMQGDGNLVEYQGGTPLWASNTAGDSGAVVEMQSDGNLVIYLNGVAKWASGTNGFSGAVLELQTDSNLVIYQGSHPLWDRHSGYIGYRLTHGTALNAGQVLVSPNHVYRLVMQGDGNLVEYKGGTAVWATNTDGDSGAVADMQSDGNLVIYLHGSAKWASGTNGFSGAELDLQSDSNLVIYQGANPLWDRKAGRLFHGRPSWWNGSDCDAAHWNAAAAALGWTGAGAHELGASYLGIPVCGPRRLADGAPDVWWTKSGWGEYEWECTELAFRFMAQAYGVSAYSANGDTVVANYASADGGGLVKVNNGTAGVAPMPGDVVSFNGPDNGHVAVVASSSVNASGNGSITLLTENDTSNGWRTLAVSSWVVQGFGTRTPYGWLHDPKGRGGPGLKG